MSSTQHTFVRRVVPITLAALLVFVLDVEGNLIELNRAAESMIGRSEQELMERPFASLLDQADLPQADAAFHRWMAGHGVGEDIEIRLVHRSGERRLLQLRGAPIVEDGEVVGVHGVARDITDERQREEAARLLAAALEGLEEGVAIYTEAGEVIYHNAAHARILDYDHQGPIPNIRAFAPDDEAHQEFDRGVRAALASGSWSGRLRRRRIRDGGVVPLQVIIGRMERQEDTTLLISIVRDNSEDLAAERRLQRAERLASVGTLIGGVAHELNNPLHAIRNFAELLLESPRDAEEREDLETIRREADRAARIVSDLRLLAWQSQTEEGSKQPVDLNDVVDHVLRVRNYSLTTSNIRSQRDFAAALPPIMGDRGKLEQVVLNLVVNAEQAMADQGREKLLTIRTRGSDRTATLTVGDTGSGISPDNLERLFDPFWTTKAPGEGTGLGLPLVHGIVKEHGGEIHVESEPGRGTAFRLEFPVAPEPRTAPTPAIRTTQPAGRSLRILVVEDEAALRRSLERYLRRRGHEVICAADGSEALRLLDSGGEFDAILSDLRMPGMGGEGLLSRLRADPRGLHRRLILMTGDAASPQAVKVLRSGGAVSGKADPASGAEQGRRRARCRRFCLPRRQRPGGVIRSKVPNVRARPFTSPPRRPRGTAAETSISRATIPMRTATLSLLLVIVTAACVTGQEPAAITIFTDVTATHLPTDPSLHALDGVFVDVDGDGDLDIAVAVEGGVNRIYLNDGAGNFVGYTSTEPARAEQVREIMLQELRGIQDNLPDQAEWQAARNKVATAVTLGAETPYVRLMSLGNSWLYRQEFTPVNELVDRILNAKVDDVERLLADRPFDATFMLQLGPDAGGQ